MNTLQPAPAIEPALSSELSAFVVHEARLLDESRLDEWLELFAPDGRYWVPAAPGQQDMTLAPSLALEDVFLLRLRIERLRHPQAHSQHPPSRALHLLQAPHCIGADARAWRMRTPFLYFEQRGADQLSVPGTATHDLVRIDGTLRIQLKRVDLLAAGQALPMIQLFP